MWLPEERSRSAEEVESRRLRARDARSLEHEALPVARNIAAPEMAVLAAREALEAAGTGAGRLDALCHAWMYYQGHDLWSPAHYIAHEIRAHRAVPFGIQQVCNGGAAAVELMAAYLATPDVSGLGRSKWGMVTTADRFIEPGFARWTSDYGVAYGDGSTAVLLRSPAGPGDRLRLLAAATVAAPELESMHRGADPFAPAPRTHREKVDMRATKRAYLHERGDQRFSEVNERSIHAVTDTVLRDAGVGPHDPRLRYAVLPRFGMKLLNENWIPVLSECVSAKIENFGQDTGHLGAGDALANLADLMKADLLAPGEMALVFSAGAGFTWSCLLVEAVGGPAAR
ncbi:3-oxoacyl-ACP synthase [Streptomyces sp. tea 10]|nr:3-oxoacyl-ACP synthase [Streptomyces sp. tea 10]